jgi:hypothetical protein
MTDHSEKARELAERVYQLERDEHYSYWSRKSGHLACQCGTEFESGVGHEEHVLKVAEKIVAEALAACRLEARIAEVEHCQMIWSNNWNDDLLGELFDKRIAELRAALERAAGQPEAKSQV